MGLFVVANKMYAPYTIRGAIDTLLSKTEIVSPRAPVDVLAVVLSIVQSPQALQSTTSKLWITDESISPQVSVCVVLYGSNEASRITQEQIAIGSVIRFNNLALRKGTTQDSTIFELIYCTNDPEPGLRWLCFGSLLEDDRCVNNNEQSVDQRIPESMLTYPKRILDLKTWFCDYKRKKFLSALSPMSCKKRVLSETQASIGLLSNLAVSVLYYECQQTKIVESPSKKRRRSAYTMTQSPIGYATFTDSSGVNMSFVDLNNRFSETLRKAKEKGLVVLLTNVSSTKQSDVNCIQGKNLAFDEVILVPTTATVAVLLSNKSESQKLDTQTVLKHSNQTQISSGESERQEITLVSSILDISINGKLLHQNKCLDSPSSLVKSITKNGHYREVIMELESFGTSSQEGNHVVLVNPSIMQTLCGGVSAKELIEEERLRSNVFQLVQALLREQVLLFWTIQRSLKDAIVLKVMLPKL